MAAIFISHSTKDDPEARSIGVWLEQLGHKACFIDHDEHRGIVAGSDWLQDLYQRLRQCQAVVALVTPNWIESKFCFAEMILAREKGKQVFPVKLEPCDLPEILSHIQEIDLTVDKESGYRRLAAGLIRHGLDPRSIFVPVSGRPPYPGFPAFEEADAAVFFGRRDEIRSALDTLESRRRHNRDVPRLVVYLGASGSGKSSLVRAGLIPWLKKDEKNWLPLRPFRPQDERSPLDALAFAIAGSYNDLDLSCDRTRLWSRIRTAAESTPINSEELLKIFRELASTAGRDEATVLITVDQAEELLNAESLETGKTFLKFLGASLSTGDRHLMAVATLRSDSLGVFENQVASLDSAYRLGLEPGILQQVRPIPFERYPELIREPARQTGFELEDSLVDKLLQDAGQPDSLPLLAFTLRRLYDLHSDRARANQDGTLTLQEYEDLGGLAGAVQNVAERIFNDRPCSDEEINAFREAFIPGLIRYNEDRGYSRRRAFRDQLPAEAENLLADFVNARLLVAGMQDGRPTVEIAHEALLRTWPKLASWLTEDHDKLRQYNAIVRAAKDWDEGRRKTDLLIHQDKRLKDATELVSQRRFAFPAQSVENTYLDTCGTEQRKREAAAREEQERRLRDKERLAEEVSRRAWAEEREAKTAEELFREKAKPSEYAADHAKKRELARGIRSLGTGNLPNAVGMMFRAIWTSPQHTKIVLLGVALVAVIGATVYGQIRLNAWNRPFYDALVRKDLPELIAQLMAFGFFAGGLLILNVAQTWLNQATKVKLREGLVRDLFDEWLKPRRAFRLVNAGEIGANPDQRIHEDARHLVELSADLGIGILESLLLLGTFVWVLWVLSNNVTFHVKGYAFEIPGYMVWCALASAGAASWLGWHLGRPLIRLNTKRYAQEAELLFAIIRLNEHIDTIALYGGEKDEGHRLITALGQVLHVMWQIVKASTRLTWITAGYGWFTILAPILVAAPGYFAGGLSFGTLMMAVGAFMQVQRTLRWFIDNFSTLADWRATLLRVASFRETVMTMDRLKATENRIEFVEAIDGKLAFEHLEVATPTGVNSLSERHVEIVQGERVLIVGEPGTDIGLLFRAIAGLWPWGSGRIALPSGLMFVMCYPYVPLGTLRGALAYPSPECVFNDEELVKGLQSTGLDRLSSSLDRVARWDKELTLNEQQCLVFTRILLHKPRWVLMDRGALDQLKGDARERVINLFKDGLNDATAINFGFHRDVEHFFTRVLHFIK